MGLRWIAKTKIGGKLEGLSMFWTPFYVEKGNNMTIRIILVFLN